MQSFDFVVVSKRPKHAHREFARGKRAPHKAIQIIELRAAHVPERTDGLVFGNLELRTLEGSAFKIGQTYRLDLAPAVLVDEAPQAAAPAAEEAAEAAPVAEEG